MEIKLGTLEIRSALEHPEMMASAVFASLKALSRSETIGVAEIDPALSDTAAFCERYRVPFERAANCVVLEARRADKEWLSACVVLANTRADVNGLVRRTLDARRASFAPMQEAVEKSGMEYGAITPIGLPADWPIFVDAAVVAAEYVIIGSGIRRSKLVVPGAILRALPGVQVLERLGLPKGEVS